MITVDILDAIKSRAAMLSNSFYFLDKDDLCQDGMELALKLEKKQSEEKFVLKAINNFYSNVLDKAITRNNHEVNMSSFEYEPDVEDLTFMTPEDIVAKDEITRKLMESLSGKDKILVELLSSGVTVDEMATQFGVTKHEIRKKINNIIKKRKEIEE